MIKLLRLLKGYVEFCAEGGFAERFLNLCRLRGINLWNVKNDGDQVEACATISEFESINGPAENSGMKIKVRNRRGFSFWLKRHKWRCGIAVGVALAISCVWFMSGFIWEVEIVEVEGVEIEGLSESVSELGVKKGTRKSDIDILDIQEKLLAKHPEVSWVSLNIFGGKAQIEYTPAKKMMEKDDVNIPMNVVARKNGKITLMEGYRGTNAVKEGAYVAKGSLLISGVLINGDGSETLVHASGKVFAQTKNKHNFSVPSTSEGYVTTQPEKRYYLNFFNFLIPLTFYETPDYLTETEMMLEGNSAVLPVGVLRKDGFSSQKAEIVLTEKEMELVAVSEIICEKRCEYNNSELQKIAFSKKITDDTFQVSTEIVCIENIAEEKAVYIEKN